MAGALQRLSGLDSSFLTVEDETSHMHVGWAALFGWPADGGPPAFADLREHVAERLERVPRCRQRVVGVPLGLDAPRWVDDPAFDLDRHVRRLPGRDFRAAVDEVLSRPLDRSRPLWELWIADELEGGRVGVVGKAHHAMVDGIAAIELAMLLVDPDPALRRGRARQVRAVGAVADGVAAGGSAVATMPGALGLLGAAAGDQLALAGRAARAGAGTAISMLRAASSVPRARQALGEATGGAAAGVRALAHAVAPAPEVALLSQPPSAQRMLAGARRPLEDIQAIRRALGGTVNDVVLAAVSGGMRRFALREGAEPGRPKVMVPVNVRAGEAAQLGNRITFLFIDLPCDEGAPLGRLEAVKQATRDRKRAREPQAAAAIVDALELAPRPVQVIAARLLAAPRAFNLVVSNIPGPPIELYMLGCPLQEVYPVVPIAQKHPLSVGFTTVQGHGFFGIHADAQALPGAGRLARDIADSVDELLVLARRVSTPVAAPGAFSAHLRRRRGGEASASVAGPAASASAASDEIAAEFDAAAAGLVPLRPTGEHHGPPVPA